MKKLLLALPILAFIVPQNAKSVTRSNTTSYQQSGVTLTMADPSGSIYDEGESVDFSAKTDRDGYVLIFNIDSDGFVHLLYPTSPKNLRQLSAGETLRIPEKDGESFFVSGRKGVEFVFGVSVPKRDMISDRELDFITGSERTDAGYRVDGDPFLAANRITRQVVRGARYGGDVSMAFTYFYVREAVDYPRYLCEDCYEKGTDPYETDQAYHPTSAFDKEDHLSFPLPAAFSSDVAYNDEGDDGAKEKSYDKDDSESRVYASYYPAWRYGYNYYPSSYYYDPWYYPSYYYPRHGFYFSIGWNWGHRYSSHYPYYSHGSHHGGHHFAHGGQGHNGHGHNGYTDLNARSLRMQGSKRTKSASTLHTAMNRNTSDRVRYQTKSVRPRSGGKSRSIASRRSNQSYKSSRSANSSKEAYRARTRPIRSSDRFSDRNRGKRKRGYGAKSIRSRGRKVDNSNRSPHRARSSARVRRASDKRHVRRFDRGTSNKRVTSRSFTSSERTRSKSTKFGRRTTRGRTGRSHLGRIKSRSSRGKRR